MRAMNMALNNTLAQNILMERQLWLRRMLDPQRDIDAECGHPIEVTTEDCAKSFMRGDIAGRVVSVWPDECWSDNPEIFETDDENETAFEKEWVALDKKLRLCTMMHRADVLSGIGRFGVILLGIDDGQQLITPAPGVSENGIPELTEGSSTVKRKLMYVRTFDESVIAIDSIVEDVTNPRYGLPQIYSIILEGTKGTNSSLKVHWSRIIHLADNRTSSDVLGSPRLERVFNRLLDLKKVASGSGEMFWKGGFPGLSLETFPTDNGTTVEIDEDALKKQIDSYQNGLQRYLALVGMQAKSLSPQVADPAGHVDVQLKLIAAALGVPWRVFIGSEQAQLASEQDTRAWNKRLTKRRNDYCTPFIVMPLIERLVAFGVLPAAKEVFVEWPNLYNPSDKEKSEVTVNQTKALGEYVSKGVDALVPPFHYLTLILGKTDEEADAIIKAAEEQQANEDGLLQQETPEEEAARVALEQGQTDEFARNGK